MRVISEVLGTSEPELSQIISDLEEITGRPGHDIRLVNENLQNVKAAIKQLGLDEVDTSEREVYYALRSEAIKTDQALARKIGADNVSDAGKIDNKNDQFMLAKKVKLFVEKAAKDQTFWVIRPPKIKSLIKKHPPRKVMKILGLRSVDSMIKRHDPGDLLSLAYCLESKEWIGKFQNEYKNLTLSDFTDQKIKINVISKINQSKLQKENWPKSRQIIVNYETATITVIPASARYSMDTSALVLSLLQAVREVKIYSSYTRFIGLDKNFNSKFIKILKKGLPGSDKLQLGWRILYKYLGSNQQEFEKYEQPHFQTRDLSDFSPIVAVTDGLPELSFWSDYENVFMPSREKPVSFNLIDVVINAANDMPSESAVKSYLSQQIWDELACRYLVHPKIMTLVKLS